MWQVFRSDTVAVVPDGQTGVALGRHSDGNADVASRRRVTDRIVDQDHGQLMEAIRIAKNFDGPRRLELQIVGGGERFRGMYCLRGDLI